MTEPSWAALFVIVVVAVALVGVLVLPLRRSWNADGAADARRDGLVSSPRRDASGEEE